MRNYRVKILNTFIGSIPSLLDICYFFNFFPLDTIERRMSLRKRVIQKYVGEDSPPSKSQKRKDTYAKEINTLEAKGLLTEFREKEAIRQQLHRASMSDEKRKVYNEKTKERMRKYREKLKNNANSSKNNTHILTRKETKTKAEEQTKKRLYWTVKQQESRAPFVA